MINIIIPVYNVEKYIRRCLDSIVNQDSDDFRAIIVDDGATDSSGQICEEYAKKDSRIIVYHKTNGGLSSAVKYGIENSPECDYFMFVDGDDFLDNSAVKIVDEIIKKYNSDIVIYDYYIDYEHSKRSEVVKLALKEGVIDEKELLDCKESYVLDNRISPTRCNKVFKSESVKNTISYYNEKVGMAEDWLFTTINLFNLSNAYYVSKPLLHYVQSQESMTHKYRESYLESYKIVHCELESYFGNRIIADRILFQHIKTLVQKLFLYGGTKGYAKRELDRIRTDSVVKIHLKTYKPKVLKDKILKSLIKNRSVFLLKILTKINNR